MNGHAYFPDDCDIVGHNPGDRHWSLGSLDQEWTGEVWTVVCPVDDVPMSDRDDEGWLRCGVCHLEAVDAPVRTKAAVRS